MKKRNNETYFSMCLLENYSYVSWKSIFWKFPHRFTLFSLCCQLQSFTCKMQISPKAPIDICLLISLDWKWRSNGLNLLSSTTVFKNLEKCPTFEIASKQLFKSCLKEIVFQEWPIKVDQIELKYDKSVRLFCKISLLRVQFSKVIYHFFRALFLRCFKSTMRS